MSVNKDEQIAALKDLQWWLSRQGPDIREWFFEEGADASAKLCLAEVEACCRKHYSSKCKAEKRLLASGYPVPDHWLRLHTGEMAHGWKRGVGDTISVVGVDDAGLQRAEREISLAILRLANEPGPAANDASVVKTDPVAVAVTMKANNPTLSGRKIAKAVGMPHSTLASSPLWKAAADRMKQVGAGTMRRGRKSKDGQIEAIDD